MMWHFSKWHKNLENTTVDCLLSFPAGQWLFVRFSAGAVLRISPQRSYEAVNTLGRTKYTLLYPGNITQLSLILKPQQTVKAVTFQEKTSNMIYLGAFDLLIGLYDNNWQMTFDGIPAALYKIHMSSSSFAVVIELHEVICKNGSKGTSRIEFRSRDIRRISHADHTGRHSVLGYVLHKNVTEARAVFILSQRCRYHATVSISYLDTLIVMAGMYGHLFPYLLTCYFALALTTSLYAERYLEYHSDFLVFCCALVGHFFIVALNTIIDWFALLISTGAVIGFTYICQCFAWMMLFLLHGEAKRRWEYRMVFMQLFWLIVIILINYHINGYIALLIATAVSMSDLKKATINLGTKFSVPVLCFVGYLYIVASFSAFGLCSFWNLSLYGTANVYEDPARVPTYTFVMTTFLRPFLKMRTYYPQEFVPIIGVAFAVWKSSVSVAELGMLLIVILGLTPFVQTSKISLTGSKVNK